MFGKFQNNFVKVFSLLFIISPSFPQEVTDTEFNVNQFAYDVHNSLANKGLRLMGIGNFFYNNKAFAQAVPYYQEALEYLPNEADISFRLATIYQNEKIWQLSHLYYKETITLLAKSENFGKSQLNAYISRIRIIQIAHATNDPTTADQVKELRKEESIMRSLYPEAWEEFALTLDSYYPETAIRTPQN